MRAFVRHVLETLVSAVLLVVQTFIPLGRGFHMVVPLIVYLTGLEWTHPDFELLLFSQELLGGRIVAIIGFAVFLTAFSQYLLEKGDVITSGIYSFVRHPQYLGITVITLGLTVMCRQHRDHTVSDEALRFAWLIQTVGYILLALYEEHALLKEHTEEYQQYKRRVPFLFPIPCLSSIPEPLVTMIIFIIMSVLLV